MWRMRARMGTLVVVVAGLTVGEPSLAGPLGSPSSGLSASIATGLQERQRPVRAAGASANDDRSEVPARYRSGIAHQRIQPVGYASGDVVRIAVEGATLMRGHAVLARLREGQELTVLKVQGPWLGTTVVIDGQKISGWVPFRQVAHIDAPLQVHALQVNDPINLRAEEAKQSVQGGQEMTTQGSQNGRSDVGTRSAGRWNSNVRPVPESLRNFRWGWWDVKDRW